MKPNFHFIHVLIILLQQRQCIIAQTTDCKTAQNCAECIRQPNCAWCTNPEFEKPNHQNKDTPRCDTVANHKKSGLCSNDNFIEFPEGGFEIIKDVPVRQRKEGQEPIHIQPQEMFVKLRVGDVVDIPMHYLEADDKPVDMYYIMDLSATMSGHRATVAEQAPKLVEALNKITQNIKIGFGSFVDKPVLPYVSSAQLDKKVQEGEKKLAIPYGFKNHVSLTEEVAKFRQVVATQKNSSNLDAPEGGFDAIMQAIVCKEEIGWRKEATKIIVFASDGSFHIAGDGKLGGIVLPNDGKCHMVNNEYSHSTLLDYPSVAQLNYAVTKNGINLIFAVAVDQRARTNNIELYRQLTEHITNSKAAQLETEPDSIIKIVHSEYQKIKSTIQLRAISEVQGLVNLTSYVKCPGDSDFRPGETCENINVKSRADFKIRLQLRSCPKDTNWQPKVKLTTFSLNEREELLLNLKLLCNCDCSQTPITDPQILAETCNGKASALSCGTCNCKTGNQGRNCECAAGNDGSYRDETNCRNNNITCSNRGECECGQCKCQMTNRNLFYSGAFCQCDPRKCFSQESSQEMCSGPGQGRCNCETCVCNPEYEGDKCQCFKDTKICQSGLQNDPKECSNKGECVCENPRRCRCVDGYRGKYCEQCESTRCAERDSSSDDGCKHPLLIGCLKCHINSGMEMDYQNELYKGLSICEAPCKFQNSHKQDTTIKVTLVKDFKVTDYYNEISCEATYNDTCDFMFRFYESDDGSLQVQVRQNGLICRPGPPTLWIILGIVGGVLLIGIITILLWKLFTHIHDGREFSKFENERRAAKFNASENPLYSKPMTEFSNPAYRG